MGACATKAPPENKNTTTKQIKSGHPTTTLLPNTQSLSRNKNKNILPSKAPFVRKGYWNSPPLTDSKRIDAKLDETKYIQSLSFSHVLKRIDLKIYETPTTFCRQSNKIDGTISNCSALLRLSVALAYYQLLFGQHYDKINQDKQKEFLNFSLHIYKGLLDDWDHFISKHSSNLQLMLIADELIKTHNIKPCDMYRCNTMIRHYRRQEERNHTNSDRVDAKDGMYAFFVDCYDRFHHHIFHLFELGLRVKPMKQTIKEDKKHDYEDIEFKSIDKDFQKERDLVRKFKKLSDFTMYNEKNNKFNLKLNTHQQMKTENTNSTFLDELYSFLEKNGKIHKSQIKSFAQYLRLNEYDSDAVRDGFDALNINHTQVTDSTTLTVIHLIKKFIQNLQLSKNSFSTGFLFYYEKDYHHWDDQGNKHWEEKKIGDLFDGYSKFDLFVLPHFECLKHEILESTFVNIKQWEEKIVLKGQQYNQTNKGKNMELSHIYCIILYCDWSELCTDFSSTYRRINEFESIELIKTRHSKYYYFGKGLKNAVNKFGKNGWTDNLNTKRIMDGELGPFYCGIAYCLNIPSFAIFLKGPCSTSKNKEIAINFAKRNGIIIQLQNDKGTSWKQNFFDCSWISTYSEENERLFIAGVNRLRIQSIIIIKTAQNFERFMKVFYIFDAMISGVNCRGYKTMVDISASDIKMLNALINGEYIKFDDYIINTFRLFTNRKTRMYINVHYLATEFKPISHLLIPCITAYGDHETTVRTKFSDIAEDSKDNLLNPKIFFMFPNLDEVVINTTYDDGKYYSYQFSLLSFLSSILQCKSSIKYIIKARASLGGLKNWCDNTLSDRITARLRFNKWNVEYKRKLKSGYGDSRLIIHTNNPNQGNNIEKNGEDSMAGVCCLTTDIIEPNQTYAIEKLSANDDDDDSSTSCSYSVNDDDQDDENDTDSLQDIVNKIFGETYPTKQ